VSAPPATGEHGVAERIVREMTARHLTLALAESCTGGLVAARITDVPGASAMFLAGVVAYANSAKETILGVRKETLARYGAVSGETVREMALGACQLTGADAAISVTGIAGPGGGSTEKPVGTVWIGAALGGEVVARRFHFEGDREEIRERAAQAALTLLWQTLRPEPA
jgi:PncC family amidohydrolase